MKMLSSDAVTLAKVKEMLEAREKEGELGYEQKQTLDYAAKFAKKTGKEAEDLVTEIMKNPKITRECAVSIVNVQPKTPQLLRTVMQKDKVDITPEEMDEVLKLIK
jgi:DNA-directed RNA polymerase subunit F